MFLEVFNISATVLCILFLIGHRKCDTIQNSKHHAELMMDLLQPYKNYHGQRLKKSNRHIRECQEIKYGNVTHSKVKVKPDTNISYPLVEVKHLTKEIGSYYYKNPVTIRYQRVDFPLNTLSVLEPGEPGTCREGHGTRSITSKTALSGNCIVGVNGGFFNTTTGACLGNIVSNGRLVQDSQGLQNAHFGITEDGYIYVGYLSELDLITQQFKQLLGGVLWLIRDGEKYIDKSKQMECPDVEETGTIETFIEVQSARSAVGHDKDGRVIMVQVDGKTNARGVNLHEFTDILLELGVVNAINLDGGGSTTTVINHTLVNYPSDKCADGTFSCEREISTILCVHEPECQPNDCNQHGHCVLGKCVCDGYWVGSDCSSLSCPFSCSHHGTCTKDGCICDDGWYGINCSTPCKPGYYGSNCAHQCYCLNHGTCNSQTGHCVCSPGFTGKYCESLCEFGYYGDKCNNLCTCDNGCFCHHVTGSCNLS
ncbi:hypothetical protein LOTGIDRAFT_188920, partial [Lottia gigantea]